MQIPLLVGARPKFASRGPVVDLAGRWRVYIAHPHLDSVVKLNCVDPTTGETSEHLLDGKEIEIVNRRVYAEFAVRGSEAFVTVMAQRGPNVTAK